MGLEIHSDDTMASCKKLDIGAEHLNRPESPVQQDEWRTRSKILVGELDTVHVRQGGGARWFAHFTLNLAELINVSGCEVH